MPIGFPPNLLVGTSSWSSPDWCGSFYPDLIEPGEMIRVYSSKLPTVEIDATWYRMPSPKMIEAWKSKTPCGFIFSAKVPKVISHDKYLEGCEAELNEFISVMSGLGDRLGPMILQFPYVAKGKDPQEYKTGADFIRRLEGFVRTASKLNSSGESRSEILCGYSLRCWIFCGAGAYRWYSSTTIRWIRFPSWQIAKRFLRLLSCMCASWETARKWMPRLSWPRNQDCGNGNLNPY